MRPAGTATQWRNAKDSLNRSCDEAAVTFYYALSLLSGIFHNSLVRGYMRTLIVICSILVLLGGCSTMEVQHSTGSAAKISSLSSFAWMDSKEKGGEVRTPQPSVDRYVRQAVERELVIKGYSRGEPDSADFLISWFGKVDEKVQEQDISHFYDSYGYGGALAAALPEMVEKGAVRKNYEEGTLVIDVIDRESGNLLWRGAATDTFVQKVDDKEAGMIINKAVREIMSKFPSR